MMNVLTTTQSGALAIVLSFLSMRLLLIIAKSIFMKIYPGSICEGPPRKQWMFRNISISLVHSLVTAILSVYCFFDEPAMLSDMIGTWTWISYYVVCFSMGYFIHDLLELILNNLKKSGALLLHHVVVIGAFGIAIFTEKYVGFAICSLLMEINSVFLHSRRLMCFYGVSKTSYLYGINGIFILFTFIMFRFLSSGWMLNYVIKHRHVMPSAHALYGSFGMAGLIVINIMLFLLIWNSDFKKRLPVKD